MNMSMAFTWFLVIRYQNYTGKAIFMPCSIDVGIVRSAIGL